MVAKRSILRLEENNCHSHLKRKKEDIGNYDVNQPHLIYWESDIEVTSGIFFQVLRKLY